MAYVRQWQAPATLEDYAVRPPLKLVHLNVGEMPEISIHTNLSFALCEHPIVPPGVDIQYLCEATHLLRCAPCASREPFNSVAKHGARMIESKKRITPPAFDFSLPNDASAPSFVSLMRHRFSK